MLGDLIQTARRTSGLTQHAVAEKAGISVPTVRNLETGFGTLNSWGRVLGALSLDLVGRNLPPGETMGARLAILRKRRGLSQREAAGLIGTTQPTLVSLECRFKGRVEVLDKLLAALGAGPSLVPRGTALPFYSSAANASVVHNWQTPKDLLEKLYAVFGAFDLDPCSPTHDRAKAPVNAKVLFTEADDGLSMPWHGTVFLNPPYGRQLPLWISKSRNEVAEGRARIAIALIPSRTDTAWWHNDIAQKADVFFLRGRLRFGDASASAPFPSALIVWGAGPEIIASLKENLPPSWHQGQSL